jgi:alpha-tubulin suppressor-like RCC1 family protein
VALDEDGNIWIWGSDPAFQFKEETKKHYSQPIQLTGLPKFTKIACGSWHSLAIDENKNVWAWGKNHFGMLGTGDTISRSSPILVKSLKNIVDIGGGCFQSIAVDSRGKIFTFGDNPSGQLGLGNYSRCYSPKLMPLDMNGTIMESLLASEQSEVSKKDDTIDNAEESLFNTEFILRILKYALLALSVLLNVVLFRKLRCKG